MISSFKFKRKINKKKSQDKRKKSWENWLKLQRREQLYGKCYRCGHIFDKNEEFEVESDGRKRCKECHFFG
ncbi:hypothetical protein DRN69_08670 [Candidatus Pacearchaeota archaeon]|nr:MAG: hypothetical protein DRN69_08670 [Candidatus Pacearchaeota archaeon]